MLALSIRQPWPWAILNCGKDIENRNWPTRVRGEFLIHAAAGMTKKEYREFVMFYESRFPKGPPVPTMAALDRGGIVGKARVSACVQSSTSPWFFGPFGFVIEDVEPLPFRPLKGELGFFGVDESVVAA